MKTVVIGIGNSDDKLSQVEWTDFVNELRAIVSLSAWEIHFSGLSDSISRYQNACMVFDIEDKNVDSLEIDLFSLKKKFRQDHIAIIDGKTRLI